MGTNYYWHEKPACEHCGREFESKHIGKSSAGWCFSLHVEPESGINDLEDWQRLWTTGAIIDEYGTTVTPEQMLLVITDRSWELDLKKTPLGYSSWRQFHEINDSEPGPNNLLRHRLGRHCLKHGAGTWDCIAGEFC